MTRTRATPIGRLALALCAASAHLIAAGSARADETCQSPYMAKITGIEDFVYVWTLGVDGLGDGSDKLVTIDARETSPTFGKPIHAASVGGRHEAHHGGFTDDRRQFWAAGLSDSKIFLTLPSRTGSKCSLGIRSAGQPPQHECRMWRGGEAASNFIADRTDPTAARGYADKLQRLKP